MFRDDFDLLPIGLRVKLLADKLFAEDRFIHDETPRVPLPPKFDQRMRRKDGYQWASETDLASLRYWQGKALEGSERGGQYAEKDAKLAKSLGYWITWREAFPTETWTGERNNAVVTAAPPSGKPRIHPWEERGARPASPPVRGDAYEPDPEDDFPAGLF